MVTDGLVTTDEFWVELTVSANDLRYSPTEFKRISKGFRAVCNDDKFDLIFEEALLFVIRKPTRFVNYVCKFSTADKSRWLGLSHRNVHFVSEAWVCRDPSRYRSKDDDLDLSMISRLIDHKILGKDLPIWNWSETGIPWDVSGNTIFTQASGSEEKTK
jgi:hypothetical protein